MKKKAVIGLVLFVCSMGTARAADLVVGTKSPEESYCPVGDCRPQMAIYSNKEVSAICVAQAPPVTIPVPYGCNCTDAKSCPPPAASNPCPKGTFTFSLFCPSGWGSCGYGVVPSCDPTAPNEWFQKAAQCCAPADSTCPEGAPPVPTCFHNNLCGLTTDTKCQGAGLLGTVCPCVACPS